MKLYYCLFYFGSSKYQLAFHQLENELYYIKINYTLTENRVKKYTTQIKGDAVTGFRVVNTYYGDEKNPLTADNVYIYISLVVVSLVGLIRFSYILFKNKNL